MDSKHAFMHRERNKIIPIVVLIRDRSSSSTLITRWPIYDWNWIMESFAWLKPAALGAVAGAAVLAFVGFSWGGWVTDYNSKKSVGIAQASAIAQALTPYCLERAKSDPASLQIMADLKAAGRYSRSDIIKKAGWATPLGSTEPNSDLAQACQIALGEAVPA